MAHPYVFHFSKKDSAEKILKKLRSDDFVSI